VLCLLPVGVINEYIYTYNLDWLNDETGEKVSNVDDGQSLKQAGSGASTLVPVATKYADRQYVADKTDRTQRADDVDIN